MDAFLARVLTHAEYIQSACQLPAGVLDYTSRRFVREPGCAHCARRVQDGEGCDEGNVHLYGAFEAERWDGLYIYYCPESLGFIAATVFLEGRAELALVLGPFGIGEAEAHLPHLPVRSPKETTALSRLLAALCAHLSGSGAERVEESRAASDALHNALYDISRSDTRGEMFEYPLEAEKKLQRMILSGDREGARELINVLLGRLYFSEDGDLKHIRDNAKGLVVLLSRAAIDGGADARQIFGDTGSIFDTIDGFQTLEALSVLLTSLFYRFVGYVFDFEKVKNADLVQKTLAFVRARYMEKITLDELAQHVHLSRAYLSRTLGEALGRPFSDFLSAFRVEQSRALLRDTSLSLADVASMSGFSDQSYFSKVFKKTMGLTPNEYRRRGHPGS